MARPSLPPRGRTVRPLALSLALSALALAAGCPGSSGPGAPGGARDPEAGLGERRGGEAVRAVYASADGTWIAYLEGCAGTKAQSLPPDTASCDLYVVPAAGGATPARIARAVTTLPGAVLASPAGAEWAVLSEYDYSTATGTLVRWRPGTGAAALAPGVSFHGYGQGGELGYISAGTLFVAPPGGEPARVEGVTEASSFELAPPSPQAGSQTPVALVRRKGSAGGELIALGRRPDGALAPEVVARPVGDYGFGAGSYAFVRLAGDGGELQLAAAGRAGRPQVLGQKVRAFAFAPRGDALAFVSGAAPGKQGELHLRAGGADQTLGKEVGEFRWAAQAPRLAWLEAYDPRVRAGTVAAGGPGRPGRSMGKNVSDFEISPDGRSVAFLQHSTRGGYSVDLLVAPADGEGKPRSVTQGAFGFAFSPDGKWLYYRDHCTRNGEGCDLERVDPAQPAAKPEKLAEGMKSFEFDPRDPERLLVTWKRMDRDALDVSVWSKGKLVRVDTYVRPGTARFLGPDSQRLVYAVVLEKRAGVYVAKVQ